MYLGSLDDTPVSKLVDIIGAASMPPWAKQVCAHRAEFADCVFKVSRLLVGSEVYGFAFALQSPYLICLSVVAEVDVGVVVMILPATTVAVWAITPETVGCQEGDHM